MAEWRLLRGWSDAEFLGKRVTLAVTALPRAHPGLRLAAEVSELPNHFLRTTPRLPVAR